MAINIMDDSPLYKFYGGNPLSFGVTAMVCIAVTGALVPELGPAAPFAGALVGDFVKSLLVPIEQGYFNDPYRTYSYEVQTQLIKQIGDYGCIC